MTVQAGKDMLIKIGDGGVPEGFLSVAGLRTRTLSFNARPVDITHDQSLGSWRELLAGSGIKACTVSGAGVFTDAAADARLRQAFFDQAAPNWQLIIPDFVRLTGPFLIAALDYSGRHDGEAVWSMTLSSAGALSAEVI
ncbi:phage major tail protein, TP901-1 family [Maricaulis sp.]|uniref:phage major tail protein, TP901-1 family n=1 Tax=Maricaulis sp. TaxID=1486257 RepID=UPI00261A6193|nr:phage major tail protein, TP901-1 family [Maricaulis sp.]